MKVTLIKVAVLVVCILPAGVFAAEATSSVKYRGAKDLNFEELLIEGAVKRPELSVVTGDRDQDNDGLLRLRENFLDRMAVDASEEIP